MDDDGFERQGRGPKQAWAGAAKGHQAPAAAQQNAWSQKSSSIRVRFIFLLHVVKFCDQGDALGCLEQQTGLSAAIACAR